MAGKAKTERAALIVVDVQNDFCPEGSLPVPDGDRVVAPLNSMVNRFRKNRQMIIATRDWHPEKTSHFKKWPPHCIQGTKGAEFHPDLDLVGAAIVEKGLGVHDDAYSGFDGQTSDGEDIYQVIRRADSRDLPITVYIGGLATDYCVKHTVLDALKLGFKVYLLLDACRAVNLKPTDEADAIKEMKSAGKKAGKGKFKIVTTKEVLANG